MSVPAGKKRNLRLYAGFLWVFIACCVGAVPSFATEIFIVASYHREDVCGRPQQEAAVEAIRQSDIPDVVFREYYLDSRRRDAEDVDRDIERVIADIDARKPALTLTFDDLAFSRLYGRAVRLPSMFLVFSGLNSPVREYDAAVPFLDGNGRPAKNITGVLEPFFMKEQFEMLEVLLRRPVTRVAVLHSTDMVGMIVRRQIEAELSDTPFRDRVSFHAADDGADVLRLAESIGADPDVDAWIPAILSVRAVDRSGRLTMPDLARAMMSRIKKPDLTLNASFTELGFYGGVSVDFRQMGFQAGIMAAKLLKGHPIREIPVENAWKSLMAVNTSRLRELGIPLPIEFSGIVDIFVK